MVNFQDGYLSKELISTSKMNGWTIYLEQSERKLSPISEKQCVWVYDGKLSRDQSMPTSFLFITVEYFSVLRLTSQYGMVEVRKHNFTYLFNIEYTGCPLNVWKKLLCEISIYTLKKQDWK